MRLTLKKIRRAGRTDANDEEIQELEHQRQTSQSPIRSQSQLRQDHHHQIKSSQLPLSLRVEKNVICLLLGRRVIKGLVRRTAGKHGAHLVDLVYKLARSTLGKKKAKKLMKRTLNVIAEVSVLTIHRKLTTHQLDMMRDALLIPLKKFQEMQLPLNDSTPEVEADIHLLDLEQQQQRRRFIRSVKTAQKELFLLLQPHVQDRTLNRFVKVAKMLRDPAIVSACFGQQKQRQHGHDGQSKTLINVQSVLQEMLATANEMVTEQRERKSWSRSRKSKSKSKSKSRKSKTTKKRV